VVQTKQSFASVFFCRKPYDPILIFDLFRQTNIGCGELSVLRFHH
jgi:hypothetical protein